MTSQIRAELGAARGSWLGRYGEPTPIRRRGAFLLASATRQSDGQPCVVLVPGPEADRARAADAFVRIERAHRAVRVACVPEVTARGTFQEIPYLELGCDAVIDGADLHRVLIDSGQRADLGAAAAMAIELGRALRAAHEGPDGRAPRPACLGRLSYANLLFARSGRFYLVGFGHNFPVEKACGLPDGEVTTFQAPEVALGGAPSPVGDHLALHLLLRSLLPLLDLGAVLPRALFGDPGPGESEILDCLRWPDVHLLAEPPSRRRSLAEAESVSERLRALCGIHPDQERLAALVRQAIERAMPPPEGVAERGRLVLGMETIWALGADGTRHVLGQAHRRIVTALAELHRRSPRAVLTMQEILAAGWPGERPIAEAGANRVYVALAQLRRMGMRDLIERTRGGYRFVPDLQISFAR